MAPRPFPLLTGSAIFILLQVHVEVVAVSLGTSHGGCMEENDQVKVGEVRNLMWRAVSIYPLLCGEEG